MGRQRRRIKKTDDDYEGPLRPMVRNCATCPYVQGGYEQVRPLLEYRATMIATPICHSTGRNPLCGKANRISKTPRACRGARNQQLARFAKIGFIEAATDEAWEKKAREMGLKV